VNVTESAVCVYMFVCMIREYDRIGETEMREIDMREREGDCARANLIDKGTGWG